MTPRLLAASLIAVTTLVRPSAPSERAAFVTTLGRDTVVVESFTRTDRHVDGNTPRISIKMVQSPTRSSTSSHSARPT
jgi:hypothetical protein